MTQYSDKVEEVRLKQDAEKWGKGVKYIHANDGIIETAYYNGDIHFLETKEGGKSWTIYEQEPQNLIDKFLRWKAGYNGK